MSDSLGNSFGRDRTRGLLDADDHGDDPRLLAAVKEYMDAVEAGQRIDRREFVARHPEIATELSACLQGLAFLDSAAGQIAGSHATFEKQQEFEADLSSTQPLGDFKLLREIGRGGMGIVYEATQVSLGRKVAVKVLPFAAALDPRHLQRFHNEAQMAAQLHHTNIVPVYAVGNERSVHFYAMQLIEGQSLADVIKELRAASGKPTAQDTPTVSIDATQSLVAAKEKIARVLPPPSSSSVFKDEAFANNLSSLRSTKRPSYFQAVAKLGVQAAEALDHAHQLGVVHRDIKPANLLLDARGTLWITDFGLAQLYADTGLTQSGDVIGTFRYMSPEQASGRAVVLDQRTDIYSLGLTLYELLTLERAIPGETRQELLHQIEMVDPEPARSIDKTIPCELETIVAKAIAKDPAERYQTARALTEDLERYLRDEPILARPPTLREKTTKWLRRHKALTRSLVAILLVIAVGLGISTVLLSRERVRTQQESFAKSEEAARAKRNFDHAQQAVDYFARVAADEFPKTLELVEMKQGVLRTLARFYRSFILENKSDPTKARQLEAAQANIEAIQEELNTVEEAGILTADGWLLREADVLADLKVTQAQRDKLDVALADIMRVPAPPKEDSGQAVTTQQSENFLRQHVQEGRAKLDAVLETAQRRRLREISRQVRGIDALKDPEVVEALSLTDKQQDAFQRLRRPLNERRPGPRSSRSASEEVVALKRHNATTQAVAELTPAQSQAWNSLLGEPFKGRVYLNQRGPGGREGPGGPGEAGGPPPDWGNGPPPRDNGFQR